MLCLLILFSCQLLSVLLTIQQDECVTTLKSHLSDCLSLLATTSDSLRTMVARIETIEAQSSDLRTQAQALADGL